MLDHPSPAWLSRLTSLVSSGSVALAVAAGSFACGEADNGLTPLGSGGAAAVGGDRGDGTVLCSPGQTLCGSDCVDLMSTSAHCGDCNSPCASGQTCQGGTCVCQAPLVACAGSCVNTLESAMNCGSCGATCPPGQVCSAGQCQSSCGTNEMQCGSDCVDVTVSPLHCGGCNHACPIGQSCSSGSCVCEGGRARG